MDHFQKDFLTFANRVEKIWKKSGSDFTFKYLKECLRITVRFIADSPSNPSTVIFVKLSKGLPVIIPSLLRNQLSTWKDFRIETSCAGAFYDSRSMERFENLNKTVTAVLTMINVFRILPTKPKVSFNSILDKFSGEFKTFRTSILWEALKDLKFNRIKVKTVFVGGESAGPNSNKNIDGALFDAFAFFNHPIQFISLLRILPLLYKLWICTILIFLGPFYLLALIFKLSKPSKLGRLSVVYDQAGKARVIAVVNWWIQQSLKPLHDSIYDFLRNLNTDATYDQDKGFSDFLKRIPENQKLYGFDLTAATDRIPIDLQQDILLLLGFKAYSWRNLLNFGWWYQGKTYLYNVGQPMGAYSSFAMLALTHHVLVRIAALRCELHNFDDYVILGDDIVIGNDKVADEYLIIMEALGVEISLGKSVISSKFTEFAKRLKGVKLDVTPLGPGLILNSFRYHYLRMSLFKELYDKSLIRWTHFGKRIKLFPGKKGKKFDKFSLYLSYYLAQLESVNDKGWRAHESFVSMPMPEYQEKTDKRAELFIYLVHFLKPFVNKKISSYWTTSFASLNALLLPNALKADLLDLSFIFWLDPSFYKKLFNIYRNFKNTIESTYKFLLLHDECKDLWRSWERAHVFGDPIYLEDTTRPVRYFGVLTGLYELLDVKAFSLLSKNVVDQKRSGIFYKELSARIRKEPIMYQEFINRGLLYPNLGLYIETRYKYKPLVYGWVSTGGEKLRSESIDRLSTLMGH